MPETAVRASPIEMKSYSCLKQEYSRSPGRIDQVAVEKITRNRNVESIRYMTNGPNAHVFVGVHQRSSKLLVVKVLPKEEIERRGGAIIKRNLSYKKLYQIMEDRIAKVFEIISSDRLFIILVDYHKRNLAKLLTESQKPLPEALAKNIFRCVLEGLNHMHTLKIAHRNLKLENILLTENLFPVLTDYSYTIAVDSFEEYEKYHRSSMPYWAPEIISRLPYDPMKADVWSFGVCLFTVLEFTFPYIPHYKLTTPRQPFQFSPESETNLSENVRNTIKATLEYDADKRITTNGLFQNPWFAISPTK